MEVSFVLSAARRYWVVVLACALLGATGIVALKSRGAEQYAASALLLVSPPSTSSATVQSDRYVANEIEVLRSGTLAGQVASSVGVGSIVVTNGLVVEQATASDVVKITVATSDAELSRKIANAVTSTYLSNAATAVASDLANRAKQVNDQLKTVQSQINSLNTKINNVMAPYIEAATKNGSPVPSLGDVDPDLDSQRTILHNQYSSLSTLADQYSLGPQEQVTSHEEQPADVAEPVAVSRVKFGLLGGLGGTFLGLAVAMGLARKSRRVLDTTHAEDLLGRELFGAFPQMAKASPASVLTSANIPVEARSFLQELSALVEATGKAGASLSVVVTGPTRSSGTTTLACALASQLAAGGGSVTLVDADSREPDISRAAHLVAPSLAAFARRSMNEQPSFPAPAMTAAGVTGLSIVGIASEADASALRMTDPSELLSALGRVSDVIVVDAGPLLMSATAMRLARACDVVVTAVAVGRCRVGALTSVEHQLSGCPGEVIVVATPDKVGKPPKRKAKR